MTDEVGDLVLRDNYLQTQAISLIEADGFGGLDGYARLTRFLERQGRLNRAVEFLPDEEGLAERAAQRHGLTRPEIAVLFSYCKIWLERRDPGIGSARRPASQRRRRPLLPASRRASG